MKQQIVVINQPCGRLECFKAGETAYISCKGVNKSSQFPMVQPYCK